MSDLSDVNMLRPDWRLHKDDPGSVDVHVSGVEWPKGKKPKKKDEDLAKQDQRKLEPLDAKRSKTPFAYEGNVLGTLREDQVPRFFGALTDSNDLPAKTVKLDELTAMQNRVETGKVKAIAENGAGSKLPVVIQHDGKKWIADGHHRLAAAWLNGEESAKVRFKNLEPEVNTMKAEFSADARIVKIDESLDLVFGWAIVCKVNGEEYYDLNVDRAGEHAGERVPEHIPEDAMLKGAFGLMEVGAPGNEMHAGPDAGHYPFVFPMTSDIAKAMGIETEKTGLMVAYKPPAAVLAKFVDGTYTGFSIEGSRLKSEMVT